MPLQPAPQGITKRGARVPGLGGSCPPTSSRLSAAWFPTAGSSSPPSAPWLRTWPACWPAGRNRTARKEATGVRGGRERGRGTGGGVLVTPAGRRAAPLHPHPWGCCGWVVLQTHTTPPGQGLGSWGVGLKGLGVSRRARDTPTPPPQSLRAGGGGSQGVRRCHQPALL